MTDMRQMTSLGRKIESGSFAIIDDEVGAHSFDAEQWQVVRRVIHSTADFDFKDLTYLSADAIDAGVAALESGAPILCDVRMIESGLNVNRLAAYGNDVHVYISDEDVIASAKAADSTRARHSVLKAHRLGILENAIVVCGNAPTFLLEVCELYRKLGVTPKLIVGVPVGFVSAVESKDEVIETGLPCIVTKGRKGGSTIAVSIIHALYYISEDRKKAASQGHSHSPKSPKSQGGTAQ